MLAKTLSLLLWAGAASVALAQSSTVPYVSRLSTSDALLAPEFSSQLQISVPNTTVGLADGVPSFTTWSTDPVTCNGTCTTPNVWLVVELRGVSELSGNTSVSGRDGNDVLDLGNLQWKLDNITAGSPPVPVQRATLRMLFKQAIPACPGSGSGPIKLDPSANNSVTLEVLLFGGSTNYSSSPGLANSTLEVLQANIKYSVSATNWSFCSPSNTLGIKFALLASNTSANDTATIQNGTDITAQIQQQISDLTGASDPNAVPVNDTGSAATPDDTTAAASQEIDNVLQVLANDTGDGTVQTASVARQAGRRKLLRRSSSSSSSRSSSSSSSSSRSSSSSSSSSGGSSSGSSSSSSSSKPSSSSSGSSSSGNFGGSSSGSGSTSNFGGSSGGTGTKRTGNFGGSSTPAYSGGSYLKNKKAAVAAGVVGAGAVAGGAAAVAIAGKSSTPPPKTTRPYWPNGGTSRPKFSSPAAALTSLPLSSLQRRYIQRRFNSYYSYRPVFGFGYRPYLFYHTWWFWPAFYSYGYYAPAMDVNQQVIIVNNNGTSSSGPALYNVTILTPPPDSSGTQEMLVILPSFQGQATYDPVISIGESDLVVADATQAAVDNVMGLTAADYVAADAVTASSDASSSGWRTSSTLLLTLLVAGACAFML